MKGLHIPLATKFKGWPSFSISKNSTIKIGNGCVFNSSSYSNRMGLNHRCFISTMSENSKIVIGNNCGFSGTTIAAFMSIMIGNDVRIGANTTIMDGDFHLDDPRINEPKPIIIEDRVWLGANVVVLKNVTIGRNTIIGVNSVVCESIPANVIAAGNPCKIIKYLDKDTINILEKS